MFLLNFWINLLLFGNIDWIFKLMHIIYDIKKSTFIITPNSSKLQNIQITLHIWRTECVYIYGFVHIINQWIQCIAILLLLLVLFISIK